MLESVLWDLRFALRQIGRTPVITAVSVALVAFGIAANAALLSMMDVVLVQPKPGISDATGLVRLYPYEVAADGYGQFRLDEFLELREHQKPLADIAAYGSVSTIADANGVARQVTARWVTGGWFGVMRLPMTLGTGFPATDDRNPGTPQAIAVVSHRFWQSSLGGDETIVGKTIRLNRVPFEIVGVLPRGFLFGESDVPVVVPYAARPLLSPTPAARPAGQLISAPGAVVVSRPPSASIGNVIARLRPDGNRDGATAALSAMAAGWGTTFRQKPLARVLAYPDGWLGPDDRNDFFLAVSMMGMLTVLVLLIACANVSVLLLGRAVVRRREIALRLALGAVRARIVRQLLTENILIAVFASVASIAFLHWANGFAHSQWPEIPFDLAPTWRTTLATLFVAGGTGVIFGLLPALHATDTAIHESLKAGGVGSDLSRTTLQRRFVVAEVAMSAALLCATGLLSNELRKEFSSMTVDPFASENVLVAGNPLFNLRYSAARVDRTFEEIRAALASQPGVVAVAAEGSSRSDLRLVNDTSSRQRPDGTTEVIRNFNVVRPVTPRYFTAANRPLVSGREFSPEDRAGSQSVIIVEAAFAERYWPGVNPLGQTLQLSRVVLRPGGRDTVRFDFMVVGVAPSRRRANPNGYPAGSDWFVPWAQMPDSSTMNLTIRASAPAAERSQLVQQVIRSVDPDLPISQVTTTHEIATRGRKEMMQVAAGVSSFAAITIFMACVGVYAVIAFGVAQRTREIGIRIAVGAKPQQVVQHFFRGGLRLAVIGTLIGVPACVVIMRYGFREMFPKDLFQPGAIAAITVIVIAVVALASYVPARGAARVQPMDALRSD